MKVAIISDVHSNLEALAAVLDYLAAERPDEIVFLGDAVGYGPEPNECLELLRKACSIMIMGNHDAAAVGLTDTEYFNIYARRAVEINADLLTDENRDYLASLQYTGRLKDLFLVHGSPLEPERWHYIFNTRDAYVNLGHFDGSVCLIGHSHNPGGFRETGDEAVENVDFGTARLEKGRRYIFNVGSVGQPRDGDPRASFAVYDEELGEISLKRVPYDVAAVQKKMMEKDLPEYLIARLSKGI